MNGKLMALAAALAMMALTTGCATTLSNAAVDSIESAFPGAKIGEVEVEDEHGVAVHEVDLTHDGKAIEVTVSADGTIVEVETELTLADVPKPVAAAIKKAAAGAVVDEIEREETRAVVRDGKLVKLAKPVVTYEAEFRKAGKEVELELTPGGKAIKEADDD